MGVTGRPRCAGALYPEGRVGEPDIRVELLGVQRRHQFAVPELQQDLGDPGDAGGAFQVPDVRLDRADRARLGAPRPGCYEGLGEPVDLDGVAQGGTGAVRLDVSDVVWVDARPGDGVLDHLRLRDWGGHCVAVTAPAVVERGAADHAVDVVAVGLGARQRLQQYRTDALARHIPIAAQAEAAAAAVGGGEPGLAELQVPVGVQDGVHAAGQRLVAVADADAGARQVQGGQRGRAHRVQREARPGQPEHVGDPVGDRGGQGAGDESACLHRFAGTVQLVLVVHHADEHADPAAGQARPGVPGVLQGVPGGLQEQPLLRVHQPALVGRDVEEQGVELLDAVEEAAPLAVRLPGDVGAGHEVTVVVPAVRGYLGDAVSPLPQVLPELLARPGFGVPAAEANDRDGVGVATHRVGVATHRVGVATHRVGVATHRVGVATHRHGKPCRCRCGGARYRLGRAEAGTHRGRVPVQEVPGQVDQALVLEEECLGQVAEDRAELARDVHDHHGFQAEALEAGTRVQPVHGELELVGHELPEVCQQRLTGGSVHAGNRRVRHIRPGGWQWRTGQWGGGDGTQDPIPAAVEHGQLGDPLVQRRLEQRGTALGR